MLKRDKIRFGILTAFALVVVVVSACGNAMPQVVETTREVPVTVVVTQLVQVIITATPLPPTPTPQFTVTPEPSATPSFQKWSSTQVADAFKVTNLEITDVRPVTKEDYGMAPMTAVEGSRFLIPSLCSDCGGRIFSFASQADLDKMKAYYVELGKASALLFSWVFVKDNILVQINGDLPEDKARQYEGVLNSIAVFSVLLTPNTASSRHASVQQDSFQSLGVDQNDQTTSAIPGRLYLSEKDQSCYN